jgi:hypothetical protein
MDTGRLGRALLGEHPKGKKYLKCRTLSEINKGHPASNLRDLQDHPLNLLFSMICSDEYIGLDITVFRDYDHFIGQVSVAFMARILYSIIHTGKL